MKILFGEKYLMEGDRYLTGLGAHSDPSFPGSRYGKYYLRPHHHNPHCSQVLCNLLHYSRHLPVIGVPRAASAIQTSVSYTHQRLMSLKRH